jgi:hypothetical protein
MPLRVCQILYIQLVLNLVIQEGISRKNYSTDKRFMDNDNNAAKESDAKQSLSDVMYCFKHELLIYCNI